MMDGINFPKIPTWVLDILATMDGGGTFYTLALVPTMASAMPIFVVRSPVIMFEIERTPFFVGLHSVVYEREGPITAAHLYFYDLTPEHELIKLKRGVVIGKTKLKHPFEMDCFMNPTHEYDRSVLRALAMSMFIHVEFYLDSPLMPYQGKRTYQNTEAVQQEAKKILDQTADLFSSEERFAKARARFVEENPLF